MNETSATSARTLRTALGIFLILLGGTFITVLWTSYARAKETRSWLATPCLITNSQVLTERKTPNSPVTYRASVRYRYTFNGVTRESDRIHQRGVDGPTTDRAKVESLCAKYPAFRDMTCFVDPEKPERAVLEHASLAALYTIWFPLLFVVGGAGMVIAAWRRVTPSPLPGSN